MEGVSDGAQYAASDEHFVAAAKKPKRSRRAKSWAQIAPSAPVSIANVGDHDCRTVVGSTDWVGPSGFVHKVATFCGRRRMDGSAYCAQCSERLYNAATANHWGYRF